MVLGAGFVTLSVVLRLLDVVLLSSVVVLQGGVLVDMFLEKKRGSNDEKVMHDIY